MEKATSTFFRVGGSTKSITDSTATGSLSPQEILERLDSYGIEWYVTERGDLLIRYWQVAAEGFVRPEQVARIREGRAIPDEADALEWVSRHLAELQEKYPGRWIAIAGSRVVAASATLPDLLQQLSTLRIDRLFITEVPAEPAVWETAYARC